ncbi:MAG: helix-turn-helix protein [Actinomycetota bacterium]|jgi:transcriptional regulator with XRE-family HTH domain
MPKTERAYTTKRSTPLAKLRVRHKKTRAQAADQLKVSVGYLGLLERGREKPSEDLLIEMEEVYGTTRTSVRRAAIATRRAFLIRETP